MRSPITIGRLESGCATEGREGEVADVRADHEDLAMGEVQELQDPVHHRVADGDQAVDTPERQPGHELIEEVAPRQLEVLEVAEELKSPRTSGSFVKATCGPSSSRWAARIEDIRRLLALLNLVVGAVAPDLEDREPDAANRIAELVERDRLA